MKEKLKKIVVFLKDTKSNIPQNLSEAKVIAFSVLADLKKLPLFSKKQPASEITDSGKEALAALDFSLTNQFLNIENFENKKKFFAYVGLFILLIVVLSLFSCGEKEKPLDEEPLEVEQEFAYVDKKVPHIIISMPQEIEKKDFLEAGDEALLEDFPEVFKSLQTIETNLSKIPQEPEIKSEKIDADDLKKAGAPVEPTIETPPLKEEAKKQDEKKNLTPLIAVKKEENPLIPEIDTSPVEPIKNKDADKNIPLPEETNANDAKAGTKIDAKTNVVKIENSVEIFEPNLPTYKEPIAPVRDHQENVLMKIPNLGNLTLPDEPLIPLLAIVEPLPELLEKKGALSFPKPADDGRSPWQIYARPFNSIAGFYPISIVLTDLGLDDLMTDAAIRGLPAEITLSFSPYSKKISEYIRKARAFGHEVLIDLPMEPPNFPLSDMGAKSLLTMLSASDNIFRLETILATKGAYSGLLGASNTPFGSSPTHMRPILERIKQSGLIYIDNTDGKGVLANRDTKVPIKITDLKIDDELFSISIKARLKYLEELAVYRGQILAVFTAKQVVIAELLEWIKTFHNVIPSETKGENTRKPYVLAPVSVLVTE